MSSIEPCYTLGGVGANRARAMGFSVGTGILKPENGLVDYSNIIIKKQHEPVRIFGHYAVKSAVDAANSQLSFQ